ncbi:MAG: hypothetical protein Q9225_006016 [Loekoesia sp. 1 TL-2023]
MTGLVATKAFGEALEKLELLVDMRPYVKDREHSKVVILIQRQITALSEAVTGNMEMQCRFEHSVETLHRLVTIRKTLCQAGEGPLCKAMDAVVSHTLSALTGSFDTAPSEKQAIGLSFWVPIVSCVYNSTRWHQKDYELPLMFGYEPFCGLKSGDTMLDVEFVSYDAAVIALAPTGEGHYVRLVPIRECSDLLSEICDIELENAQDAQTLVEHLRAINCPVIQGDVDLHVGPETKLRSTPSEKVGLS